MRYRLALSLLLTIATLLLLSLPAWPHGGGLDAYGCHHNRKHGGYHCHRGVFRGSMFDSKVEMLQQLEQSRRSPGEAAAPVPAVVHEFAGRVVGVTDGDILTVLHAGKPERIRLNGIDCPEKRQAFGKRAKQFTSRLTYGKEITVKDHGEDRYGRTIGEVILPDGPNVNHELVKAGLCWWYRKYAPEDEVLKEYEREAKEAKRGLWVQANPVPPWEWRRGKKSARDYREPSKGDDAATSKTVFDIVIAGKSCHAGATSAQTIHCECKVGTGLHFSIDGVGEEDAGITFQRSSFDDDFYASFGILHGCVIVKRGRDAIQHGPLVGPGGPSDIAFVSPTNGKVYRSWVECKQTKGR